MNQNGQLIYEPRGRAREYAALALNIYRGCDHACEYCYAPAATFRTPQAFRQPTDRGPDFIAKLEREAKERKPTEPILLCFTCDPYQELDERMGLTREVIKVLHRHGHAVHILTKGGSRALRDIDLLGKKDAFATTLTCLTDEESYAWEPGAAMPDDRIATIREFHRRGIPTWVSLEPVLDPEVAYDIIRRTHRFVDLFKVGTLNYHPHAKTINWQRFAVEVKALLEKLGCRYYLKQDLRAYLPGGPKAGTAPVQQPRALVKAP